MSNHAPGRRISLALGSLILLGCTGLFEPDEPDISASAYLQRSSAVTLPTVRVEIGNRRAQLSPAHTSASQATAKIRGVSFGEVPTRVLLLSASGDSLAAAEFTHRIERRHQHWVSALIGPQRPLGHCIGTLIATPVRADSSAGTSLGNDTLFVTYGSLPRGSIC